ncbi:hypothetical protein BC940DRAFT_371067 [Gongronella butleri]|nr:hypothetical protein BC940DRAFT_371067 [Gongronella butleri]
MNQRQVKRRKTDHDSETCVVSRPLMGPATHSSWTTSFHTPLILSSYASALFYIVFVFFVLFLVYHAFSTIRLEIHEQAQQLIQSQFSAVEECAGKYERNECDRTSFPPDWGLDYKCLEWAKYPFSRSQRVLAFFFLFLYATRQSLTNDGLSFDFFTCMQEDPHHIRRADVAARVFGELINTFFSALSFKTMVGFCLVVSFALLFSLVS